MIVGLRRVRARILASSAVWGSSHRLPVDGARVRSGQVKSVDWASTASSERVMLSAPVGDSGTNHDKGGVPVSDLPVPTAARLQRPRWRDVRLVVGVALVLASVVLGSWVVARADDRVPMYAARAALVPGQRLTQDDLVRVDVQLGAQGQRYLSAGSALAPDRFVVREVREG